MLLLSLVYFGGTFSGYGIVLFQPQIVHRLAAGFGMTGVINAIPYVFGACDDASGAAIPTVPASGRAMSPSPIRSALPG